MERYGILSESEFEHDIYKISELIKKPPRDKAPSNLAIMGRYMLTPDIFDRINETKPCLGGEIQLTDALQKLDSIYGATFYGNTYDMRITEPEQLYKLKAILPNDFNKYYIRLTPTLNHRLL